MVRIEIQDRGIGQMAQELKVLEAILPERVEEAVVGLAPKVRESVDDDFKQGGRPPGGPWAPLSPKTRKRKGHDKILVETGEMRDSFQFPVERDGDEIVMYAANAKRSHKGGSLQHLHWEGWEKLPARKAGTIADETIDKLADELAEAIGRTFDEILA